MSRCRPRWACRWARWSAVSGTLISVFLLAYGVATAVGAFGGGRFADQNAARTLSVATIGVAGSLLALSLLGTIALLVALALLALGLFGMGMGPSLQYRVVGLAGPGGQLASSLPASAGRTGGGGADLRGRVMTLTDLLAADSPSASRSSPDQPQPTTPTTAAPRSPRAGLLAFLTPLSRLSLTRTVDR